MFQTTNQSWLHSLSGDYQEPVQVRSNKKAIHKLLNIHYTLTHGWFMMFLLGFPVMVMTRRGKLRNNYGTSNNFS